MNKQGRTALVFGLAVLLIIILALLGYSAYAMLNSGSSTGNLAPVNGDAISDGGAANKIVATSGVRISSSDSSTSSDDDDDDTTPSDTIPPASITNLNAAAKGTNFIYWTWTNPSSDFYQAVIYINGTNVAATSNNYYNATGLAANTSYTITVYTRDAANNRNNTGVSDTQRTLAASTPSDTIPPASITGLTSPSKGTTSIYFTWTNPADSDFLNNILYLNGANIATTANNYYNATGLAANTTYVFSVNTRDNSGNVNTTNVSLSVQTLSTSNPGDTTPPATITGLTLGTKGTNFIYWTWTNPADSDFSQNLIYINGANVANTTNNYYNATGLAANSVYAISVLTRDSSGNVNPTAVSDTQRTLSAPAANTAPVLSFPASLTFAEDTTYTLDLNNYVTDAEDADSAIAWTFSGNSNIAVSISAGKIATLTPAANWNGNEAITFTATDSSGASTSAAVSATVTSVDDAAAWTTVLSDKVINEDLKADKNAPAQASVILYPNIASLCTDADGSVVVSVVSTSSNYNLAVVGGNLVLSGIKANWYTPAGQSDNIIISGNGVTASFKLTVNQLLDDYGGTVCDYISCYTYYI